MQIGEPAMFKPKELAYYKDLTKGGDYTVQLSQDEACVVLRIHDYGVENLKDPEKQLLYSLISKLKDEVWP
jgi:hypothetical protein